MSDLGTQEKWLLAKQEKPLGSVVGSYTYFADSDVLLAKITPCFENGKLGIARKLTNGIGFGSSEFMILRPTEQILPEFIFYFLSQNTFRNAGTQVMSGAVGHKRLPKEFVQTCTIPLPPVAEQRHIVTILDEILKSIAAARAHFRKNLANATELFDTRLYALFDGLCNAERLTLAQVSKTFGRGKSKHRPRNDPALYGGPYPFVQTGDVRNANGRIKNYTQTYNELGLAQSKLWPKGTVCITIAANIAETGILDFDGCFPDSVIGMVVDDSKASDQFVEYMLRHYKSLIKSRGKGSAQDNINLGTFETELFPFPGRPDQDAIVEELNALTSCRRKLEATYKAKLAALDELKQSILRRAFSGELPASSALAA